MARVLIVTGGSRGIGAATARLAGRRKYSVCVNYVRDSAAADRVVSAIEAEGGRAAAIQADISIEQDVRRLFDRTEDALGPVNALVNNAGVTGLIGPFADTPTETIRRVLDVNVIGCMLCAREAVRRFPRGHGGAIVNVSSVAATTGAPDEYVHYAASKAAVEIFTVGLAREVAPDGIRVNAVSPGSCHTDIHATAGEPDRPARVVSRIPLGRLGRPDEIAEAILWLLSGRASYATGAVLRVSGGA